MCNRLLYGKHGVRMGNSINDKKFGGEMTKPDLKKGQIWQSPDSKVTFKITKVSCEKIEAVVLVPKFYEETNFVMSSESENFLGMMEKEGFVRFKK